MTSEHVVLDCEVYHNYFLATFMFQDGEIIEFERHNDKDNMQILPIAKRLMTGDYTLVTFNGKRYDIPILSMAMMNYSNGAMKEASDMIIQKGSMWWELERKYNFSCLAVDHIDIINLLPLFESLKLYGARVGTAKLQDLPFDPADTISDDKARELRYYCRNDCRITWELFIGEWEAIQLRITLGEQYGQDLRSRSDAQIAEVVLSSEYERITGSKLVKPIDAGNLPDSASYTPPAWVDFRDPELKKLAMMLEYSEFELNDSGKVLAPDWLKGKLVTIAGKKYKVGLGGLHAKNRHESYYATAGKRLLEIDVVSYYPSVILNNGYEPAHMRGVFVQIYQKLVDLRLGAKGIGDKLAAQILKIVINGTFGKLGSRYSAIYSPNLMLATTFGGQLALLMLIEKMAQNGIQCVSANTDGIVVLVDKGDMCCMQTIIDQWEADTGFEMEETRYKSIHFRDVNNYFALSTEGGLKQKGIFKDPGIDKNPTTPIVAHAAMNNILYGTPVPYTICKCKDVKKFLSVRTVKGGAAKDGEYLGKAVRWYYSTETDTAIHYISNGNKVAKTDGAMPMMDLTSELPEDLDLDWYVDEAFKTIDEVGYEGWL